MQNSIMTLCKTSVFSYLNSLKVRIPDHIELISILKVNNTFNNIKDETVQPTPLITIDLNESEYLDYKQSEAQHYI